MKFKASLNKILRIFKLYQEIEEHNKLLREIYWANVFNNTISNSTWLIDKSLSPGRWAIGYPLFYVIYRILDEVEPNNILEFGLGQSSRMFHQYASHYRLSNVSTLEHDSDWINIYKANKKIPSNANVSLIENEIITYKGFETLSIANLNKLVKNNKYDLILVDAPYGSVRYSRVQILSLIPDNIEINHFCILVDDYNRNGEKDTCTEIENIFRKHDISFYKSVYSGAKEFVLYCSTDLKYLTTL